jgi:hypothetical protein
LLVLVIVAFILGPLAPAVAAGEKPAEQNGWEFQVGPYMWFTLRINWVNEHLVHLDFTVDVMGGYAGRVLNLVGF